MKKVSIIFYTILALGSFVSDSVRACDCSVCTNAGCECGADCTCMYCPSDSKNSGFQEKNPGKTTPHYK